MCQFSLSHGRGCSFSPSPSRFKTFMSESIAQFKRSDNQSRNLNWKIISVKEWKCSGNSWLFVWWLFWQMYWMTCLFYCHINYFTLSHHFASDVSFGIIKHLLTRYSGNSKFIKLLTSHLRTPICIKHTPKWQKIINKYKKYM